MMFTLNLHTQWNKLFLSVAFLHQTSESWGYQLVTLRLEFMKTLSRNFLPGTLFWMRRTKLLTIHFFTEQQLRCGELNLLLSTHQVETKVSYKLIHRIADWANFSYETISRLLFKVFDRSSSRSRTVCKLFSEVDVMFTLLSTTDVMYVIFM